MGRSARETVQSEGGLISSRGGTGSRGSGHARPGERGGEGSGETMHVCARGRSISPPTVHSTFVGLIFEVAAGSTEGEGPVVEAVAGGGGFGAAGGGEGSRPCAPFFLSFGLTAPPSAVAAPSREPWRCV